MREQLSKRKTIGRILEWLGFLSWFAAVAGIMFYLHLANNRPTSPANLMCVELCDHGRWFYVTPYESIIYHGLFFGGAIVFAVLTFTGSLLQGKDPFKGEGGLKLSIKAERILFKIAGVILFLSLCFLLWIWVSLIRLGA